MYKFSIKQPEIQNTLESLIEKPIITNDSILIRRLGHYLKQLRDDGHLIIANDRLTGESIICLKKSEKATQHWEKKHCPHAKGRRVVYEFDDLFFLNMK